MFCAVPIVIPPLLATVTVPIVVAFVSADKNCDALFATPAASTSADALSADPLNTKSVTVEIILKPFLILANPVIAYAADGVNSLFENIPISVPAIENLTTVLLLFWLSKIVTVSKPDLP